MQVRNRPLVQQPNQQQPQPNAPQPQQQQQPEKKTNDGDLKNFYLKATVCKDSISAKVHDETNLKIGFKVDCKVDSYIRVNACVTERKNPNNVPEM